MEYLPSGDVGNLQVGKAVIWSRCDRRCARTCALFSMHCNLQWLGLLLLHGTPPMMWQQSQSRQAVRHVARIYWARIVASKWKYVQQQGSQQLQ
jgi:hypothetical protein